MTDDAQIANLIAALDHSDKPTVRAAVDALIDLAPASADLKEILHLRLTEDGHKNYWPVAYVLGHLRNPSDECIGKLIETLDHREPDIRWAIALLLVRIAKDQGTVVKLLLELCAEGTANQKRMALYCIRDLALSDPASLAALLDAVNDADPTVRVAAAISLKMRPDLDNMGKKLLLQVYLKDADPKVRNAMVITLASLGAPSEEFLHALNDARQSENDQTKKAASAALDLLKK